MTNFVSIERTQHLAAFSLRGSHIAKLLATFSFLLNSTTLLASPCIYRSLDNDARVISKSGEVVQPTEEPRYASECSALTVVSGVVLVYSLGDDLKPEPVGKEIRAGRLTRAGNSNSGDADSTRIGVMALAGNVLAGEQRLRRGSSRGADSDYLVHLLPVGKLAARPGEMVVKVADAEGLGLTLVEIVAGTNVLFRQTAPVSVITIPMLRLSPGATVQWNIKTKGESIAGAFEVTDPLDYTTARDSLLKAAADNDPIVRAIRVAYGLNELGYTWDAADYLRSALLK